MSKLNTVDLKFKNLDIGYYFIFEDKAYLKVNDFSAIELFSYVKAPLFTHNFTRYTAVDKDLKYNRPTNIQLTFQPDEMIKFVKRIDLKRYINDEFNKQKQKIKFENIDIGQYFFNPIDKIHYKKISYYNAVPIYRNKFGLDDNESINITSISSANLTENKYNGMYYNGSELIKYGLNAWNIVVFEDNFKSFTFESFDTERNWTEASYNLLNFIKNIEDNKLVFITNSNNSQRTTDLKDPNSEVKYFKRIYDEHPDANSILSSIGITDNVVNNIGHGSTILIVCKKNTEILFYKKSLSYHKDDKFDLIDIADPYFIEYTYSFDISNKSLNSKGYKTFDLSNEVILASLSEVTCKLLYDLPDDEPRINSDFKRLFDI